MRILLILFLLCGTADASCHLYIIPQDSAFDGKTLHTRSRPKYISGIGVYVSVQGYGGQGFYLVAVDVSNPVDTAAQGQADVIRLPDNLDSTLGAALTTVRNKLEAINIPATGWLTSGTTYRSALRTIIHIMLFMDRFVGVTKVTDAFLSGAVTLDTTFSSLSALNRQRLIDTANSFKLDITGFTGAATLRQLFKGAADQFSNKPITLGCVVI